MVKIRQKPKYLDWLTVSKILNVEIASKSRVSSSNINNWKLVFTIIKKNIHFICYLKGDLQGQIVKSFKLLLLQGKINSLSSLCPSHIDKSLSLRMKRITLRSLTRILTKEEAKGTPNFLPKRRKKIETSITPSKDLRNTEIWTIIESNLTSFSRDLKSILN